MANKTIIPATAAVKFPDVEVIFYGGRTEKLPVGSAGVENVADTDKSPIPKASLICLSFRANSQVIGSLVFKDCFKIGF